MRSIFLFLLTCVGILAVNAQEQRGIVKTIGRPGSPGKPLDNVLVRTKESASASLSDNNGNFSLVLARYCEGEPYSLSNVSKPGYQLADAGVIGRQYPYSESIPLEISMISKDEYLMVKNQIENQVRARMDQEYKERLAQLKKQYEKETISAEEYSVKLLELHEYYDKTDVLIDKLADKYARTDYDSLDAIDANINTLIEKGLLDEAEKLILSKDTKNTLQQLRINNDKLEQTLEDGRLAEKKMVANYAAELWMQFNIAIMRYDNVTAAQHLKERMDLDRSNAEWAVEYASFIRDFLGLYDQSMAVYQDLLTYKLTEEQQASVYGNIGNVFQLKGDLRKALEAYQTSLMLREANLDMSEEYIANSYLNIASVYSEMDMFEEANKYIAQAEQLCLKYKDKEALSVLYNTKALIFTSFGKFAEAEHMFKEAIALRCEVVGEQSVRVAKLYDNLSKLYQKIDRHIEAINYAQIALYIRSKVYGENHPDVADSYLLKGELEVDMGNNSNALQFYKKALSIYSNFYGENHPDVASAYSKLAYYYHHIEIDLNQSREYSQKTLNILETIYGKMHSKVAIAINNLASVCGTMGDNDKALELYKESLKIQKNIYGDNHYKVADAYNNLASELFVLGKYLDSKTYFEKALNIYINTFGPNHSTVALIYFNLGSIYYELKDKSKEIEYTKKAEIIYKSVYGEDHPKLADIKDKIASWYYTQKMYSEAEKYYLEALSIRESSYKDDDHPELAISYNNLGTLYGYIGCFDKAEPYLLKSLTINKAIYGDKHTIVATSLANLSTMYKRQKRYDKAIEYLSLALEISEECFGDEHPQVSLYKYGLADLYFKTNDLEKAFPAMMTIFFKALEKDGLNKATKHYFEYAMFMYYHIASNEQYDGRFVDLMKKLNPNLLITATIAKGSLAEQKGLTGDYVVVGYDEWDINVDQDYFRSAVKINAKPQKTYILYRDDKFIPVQFEGRLGVQIGPKYVEEEVKSEIVKQFKKWRKKQR